MSKRLPLCQVFRHGGVPTDRRPQRSWAGLLLVLFSVAIATPALAQEQLLKTLSVTGQGVENIEATLANVRLGVEVQGATAATVQQQVAQRSDAVVKLLRSQNVDKLKTTGIRLNPRYDYRDNERRLLGYVASNVVSFQVPADAAGQLLDQAVQSGASRIDGISFTATETAIAAARNRALRSATQDAQSQANAVFSALAISPKGIVSIQVNGANAPTPRPILEAQATRALAQSAPRTPVIGGEQAVRAAVTLHIQY